MSLLVLLGGATVAATSIRTNRRSARTIAALALGLLGVVGAVVTGARLQAMPDSYAAVSASPSTWAPEYYAAPGAVGLDSRSPAGCSSGGGPADGQDGGVLTTAELRCDTSPWPGQDHMVCASRQLLGAYVYPQYGLGVADRLVAELEPEARVLAPILGPSLSIRMTPVNSDLCYAGTGRSTVPESTVAEQALNGLSDGWLISCSFPESVTVSAKPSSDQPAVGAVTLWLSLEAGVVTTSETAQALTTDPDGITCYAALPCTPQAGGVLTTPDGGAWSRSEIREALALRRLAPQRVDRALRRLLPGLVTGQLTIGQLEMALR
jgi:hypothetical protein